MRKETYLTICLAVATTAFAISTYINWQTSKQWQALAAGYAGYHEQIVNLHGWGLGTVVAWAKQKETLQHMNFVIEIHNTKNGQAYTITGGARGTVRMGTTIKDEEPVLLRIN